jgi:hypothetical protein
MTQFDGGTRVIWWAAKLSLQAAERIVAPPQANADREIVSAVHPLPEIRDMKRRVLLFNFFGGILRREIPLYVDNLSVAMANAGLQCYQLRCPRILYRMPRSVLNLLFDFTEQLIMPVLSVAFYKAIYPYNSVSMCGALSRDTAIVIHDFMSNRRSKTGIAANYIKATQRVAAKCGTDIIYASQSTKRIGDRGHRFPASRTFRFPNTFYNFLALRSTAPPTRGDAVLLCSGWGANKDLTGALNLYLLSGLFNSRALTILGLGGHTEAVESFCKNHPAASKHIEVYPSIDDEAVVHAYETAAWVWIHTLREGYVRSLAEARLCGCRVVASNIAPFREQQDESTFLYSGAKEFASAIAACESAPANAPRRPHHEHDLLVAEVQRFVRAQ